MSLFAEAERHPVTTILCVGAIAASAAEGSGRSLSHLVLTPLDAFSEPWRYLTTVFPHGGLFHLIFNLFWIWQLGRVIEARLGLGRMVALTAVAAAVASATELLLLHSAIGLSGVVYAFALFAWTRGRHDPRFSGLIDRNTLNLLIGWFFLCIVATESGFMRVANGAHAGGAAIGFLMGLRRQWLAPLFVGLIGALLFVRLGPGAPRDRMPAGVLSLRAYQALDAGQYEEALWLYEALLAQGQGDAGSHKNYALALRGVGRLNEFVDQLIIAYELEPKIIEEPRLLQFIQETLAERKRLQGSK